MQKKKILDVELVAPVQVEDWRITGTVKKLGNVMHFIGDIYLDGEYKARLAINKDDYTIFDVENDRWSRQSPWYTCFGGIVQSVDWRSLHCDKETKQKIRFFTKSKGNPGIALQDMMKNLWSKKQTEQESRRRAKELADLDLTPEIPAEFMEWTKELFKKIDNVMFYKRDTRTSARVKCGVCGEESTYRTSEYGEMLSIYPPKQGMSHICRCCGATGIYKQAGRVRRDMWNKTAYLIQNTEDAGIIIRMFQIQRQQEQGYAEYYECREVIREYLNKFKCKRYYWHRNYRTGAEGEWDRHKPDKWNGPTDFCGGEIYPRFWEVLRQSEFFKYCDVQMYGDIARWNHLMTTDIITILECYAKLPQIELMVKMGMHTVAGSAVRCGGEWSLFDKRAKDAAGFLKIEKGRLKGLGNVEVTRLRVLQLEKKMNTRFDEETMEQLTRCAACVSWEKDLRYLMQYMTLKKALNRIFKYGREQYHRATGTAKIEYLDYLKLREELGYDMTNSVYLHPRDLREAHQEMVSEKNRRADDMHIQNMLKKYPKIAERYKALNKKYKYEIEDFVIRPAKDAEEIIMEGRLLHHCVGGQTYLSKHNSGETSILFLRKKSEPEVPYITIEIKGAEIRQWYGIHDTKPDKEQMQQVVDIYVEHLKKKQNEKKQNQQIAKQAQQSLKRAAG